MPLLNDISIGAMAGNDPQVQLASVVRQLNEWGRALSNEGLTTVYKDTAGIDRILIGQLPDGTTGIVMSKDGISVLDAFN